MKIILTTIALALTSTAALASGVNNATSDPVVQSPRPPEVCRKVPIANTNAFQWSPQGCNASAAVGEAEDAVTGSASVSEGAVGTTGNPTGPTGTAGSTGGSTGSGKGKRGNGNSSATNGGSGSSNGNGASTSTGNQGGH